MKPYWKPQHEVFIRCMLKHEDPTKAYHTAYPKTKPESARVGGIRLFGYPHIRQRLQPVLNERRAERHRAALEEGVKREQRESERRDELRRVLYKVVMRQLRRQRVFTVKGRKVVFEDDPSINTILNAMVLDIRLEAGYNNWPIIERRFARIMASLLPREKTITSVMNSPANAIQALHTARSSRASLLQSCGSVEPVISTAGRNLLNCSGVVGSTALRSGPGDTLKFHVSAVTKARANPAQTQAAAINKAHINRAVVTKAQYLQVYSSPDFGLSSKSV